MSPDGEAIVTGAGDETLRFWNVFNKTRSTKVRKHRQQTPPILIPAENINQVSSFFVSGICISFKSLQEDTVTLSTFFFFFLKEIKSCHHRRIAQPPGAKDIKYNQRLIVSFLFTKGMTATPSFIFIF